jgi:hypothetical protein
MSLAACARPGPRFAAATRLKIVVSPVRVRVSPSKTALENRTLFRARPELPSAPPRLESPRVRIPCAKPRRRRQPRHRQRLMHGYVRTSLPTRAGMPRSFHGGRHLVGHLLDRLLLPESDHCAARFGELAVVASVGGACFLPLLAVATADEVSECARRSPASSRHSSTRSSSLRCGRTPRFAGWSASATAPYSRPRALGTRALPLLGGAFEHHQRRWTLGRDATTETRGN